MKLALIQLDIAWEDKKANFQKAEAFVQKAAEEKCDVTVFPEMFATGFSMNLPVVAEEGYGETPSFLSHLARKSGLHIIAGFAMISPGDEKGRNMALVFNRKGQPNATYTKIHPFSFVREDSFFLAGETTPVFEIDSVPSSVFICYDLRFPETFRNVARDVNAIFVIANWPTSRKEHWDALLKARAIENQCFIVGVNRTGIDGNGIAYPGASSVYGPMGELICSGGDSEEFITCEIDAGEVTRVREQYPFLKDM